MTIRGVANEVLAVPLSPTANLSFTYRNVGVSPILDRI